jgi:hypothetical protein
LGLAFFIYNKFYVGTYFLQIIYTRSYGIVFLKGYVNGIFEVKKEKGEYIMMNSIKEIYWTYFSVDKEKPPSTKRVGGGFVFILI